VNASLDQVTSPEFVEVEGAGDLVDGQMLAVVLKGQRILVARVDGSYHAIGAICTHERANLDEGSLLGNVVYCPLHYSAFDVRTGAVMGPPADKPIAAYRVRVDGGKVLVSAEAVSVEVDDQSPEKRAKPSGSWQARLIDSVANLNWVSHWSDWFASLVMPVRHRLEPTGVLDLLHGGRLLGHAVHPALSDLPIGLWTGSFLLYLIGIDRAAAVLSLAGLLAGAAAFLTGLADWSVTDGQDRRIGLVHGLSNTAAIVIQLLSIAAFAGGFRLLAVFFSFISLGVTLAAAYVGGHLVLGRGVMVDHQAWTKGPRDWVRTVKETELEEGAVLPAEVDGRKVLVYRGEGRTCAIEEACSHAGGPLSLGKVKDGVVTCPWHSSKFRLRDGAVLRGPASHPQPALDTRVNEGWVEVRGRS
jgi:nitrite reductase/ring-hydroxylating ferredoxin subunit